MTQTISPNPFTHDKEEFDPRRYRSIRWKGDSFDRVTGKRHEYCLKVDTHEWLIVECSCPSYYYRVSVGQKESCKHQDLFNQQEPGEREDLLSLFLWLEERRQEERSHQVNPGFCNSCGRRSIAAVCDDCLFPGR